MGVKISFVIMDPEEVWRKHGRFKTNEDQMSKTVVGPSVIPSSAGFLRCETLNPKNMI